MSHNSFVMEWTRTKVPLEFDILVVSTRKHQALSIVLFDHKTLLEIFITENFIVISANSIPLLAFILISFQIVYVSLKFLFLLTWKLLFLQSSIFRCSACKSNKLEFHFADHYCILMKCFLNIYKIIMKCQQATFRNCPDDIAEAPCYTSRLRRGSLFNIH